jgi:MFS family permease
VYFTGLKARRAAAEAEPATESGSGAAADDRPAVPVRVPFNVKMLGTVSLLTDVSSEMLVAVIGYYLVYVLHQSTTAVGLLDGLYTGVPALLAIPAAYLADRFQRRKALAGLGYSLSAATKLGFPVVGPSLGALSTLLSADRFGKGLRSGPRDALISLSSPPEIQGRAFGVHRMMDTVGACLGPLIAGVVLARSAHFGGERGAFDALFVICFCVAAIGLAVFWLYVTDHREPVRAVGDVSLAAGRRLLRQGWFLRTGVAVALLGVAWVSDTFVYLTLAHRLGLSAWQYALLASGTTATYLLLAVPVGRLADRLGRWRVFVAGHVLLVAAYLVLAGPSSGGWLVAAALILPGVAYAATDGVLMAYCGPRIPAPLRTSGLAVVQAIGALAGFLSSLAFGIAWTHSDPRTVMLWFAVAMAVAVGVSTLLVSPWRDTVDA